MTPGAQVAAAIDILAAIDAGERPADDVAADYFRRRRYIGAKDRAAIARPVYGVLRHRAALDWWIGRSAGEADARSRVLVALSLIDGWPTERIRAICDGERFRPPPLSPGEERLVRGLCGHTLVHPAMPRAVANGLPDWLEPYFERALGAALESEMAALNAPAPTDLRVNLLKADRESAQRALAAEGIAAAPTPWSPTGLRLAERAPLSGLAAFKEGLVEVQDEGSQLAALLADARPGMRVVDFCAGAGGKTLALAATMKNRGALVACDVSARRLERAARRLRRAGVSNVERRALASERDKWVKRHAGSFDRVFLDVPCLGTGTWRRNPDAKWRAQPRDLSELVERQQEILKSAARLVRPGGRLVYATCSLLREEDEAQAEAFLAAAPDFVLYPAEQAWRETIGGAAPQGIGRFARLTPARHGTDGFFVAIFERKVMNAATKAGAKRKQPPIPIDSYLRAGQLEHKSGTEAGLNLFWFDGLARRVIDPAFDVVESEARERHPDYIASVTPIAPPSRDRCLLTIANRQATRAALSGSFAVVVGPDRTLRVEQSFRWVDKGRPTATAIFGSADVTEAEIMRLARAFVDDFFDRLPTAPQ